MYEDLVVPYFDYCSEVCGCMRIGLCHRLQRLQNWAGRILIFSDCNTARSADILQDLGWDTLGQRRSKHLTFTLRVKKTCSKKNPGFIPTTYEVPRAMFLYLRPVLKLLSGLLAIGGQSCGMARKMWTRDKSLSSLPCLCLELGFALREL